MKLTHILNREMKSQRRIRSWETEYRKWVRSYWTWTWTGNLWQCVCWCSKFPMPAAHCEVVFPGTQRVILKSKMANLSHGKDERKTFHVVAVLAMLYCCNSIWGGTWTHGAGPSLIISVHTSYVFYDGSWKAIWLYESKDTYTVHIYIYIITTSCPVWFQFKFSTTKQYHPFRLCGRFCCTGVVGSFYEAARGRW